MFELPPVFGHLPEWADIKVPARRASKAKSETLCCAVPSGRLTAQITADMSSSPLDEIDVKKPGSWLPPTPADEPNWVRLGWLPAFTFQITTLSPPLVTTRPVPSA